MQAGAQTAASAASTEAAVPPTTNSSNSAKNCSSSGGNGLSSSNSSQRVRAAKSGLLDAEVAASAAQLGANADRLLNLLDRRKQKQQKQQHLGQGPHQQQRKQGIQRGLQSPINGGLEMHTPDEPICTAGVDYLRL
jgi:hypothetical protein